MSIEFATTNLISCPGPPTLAAEKSKVWENHSGYLIFQMSGSRTPEPMPRIVSASLASEMVCQTLLPILSKESERNISCEIVRKLIGFYVISQVSFAFRRFL